MFNSTKTLLNIETVRLASGVYCIPNGGTYAQGIGSSIRTSRHSMLDVEGYIVYMYACMYI
jgi:hypothetical protein